MTMFVWWVMAVLCMTYASTLAGQGNHYQYDELRRARHSTMMVLYHLHNPSAPAFVHTCNKCNSDIVSGTRWHCDVCPDFDLCSKCKNQFSHPHPLTRHNVAGGAASYVDEKTRKAR